MRNKYHILRQNHKVGMQTKFIFFDTETNIKKTKEGEEQTLRLGWAKYWDKKTNKTINKYFKDKKTFWDFVEHHATEDLIIYAHNVDFDFKIVDGYNEFIIQRHWELKNVYVNGTVFMMTFKKGNITVRIYDTMNYIPLSLEKIGENLNFPKMKINFSQCTDEELSIYCKNDVKIIYELIKKLIFFLEDNDLTKLKPTAGSLALNCFRHKFYREEFPIYIHASPNVIDLERRSYRGGITDCFKVGKFKEKLYKLDVNSMYPSIMRDYDSPVKLLYYGDMTLKEVRENIKENHVILDCLISLPEEYAYILTTQKFNGSEKSVFLKGDFKAVLTTPEIEYALKYGKIKKIYSGAIYERRNIFNDYVTYFYNKRVEYKKSKNKSFELFCKLMLNTLYGKFGQKETSVRFQSYIDRWDIKKYDFITEDGDYSLLHLGNRIFRQSRNDNNAYDSFVAISSLITSYSRMALIDFMLKCGRENLYYADTDSLIVNQRGFDNLKDCIDEHKLGYLKLEETSTDSMFIRPKFYDFNGLRKCKGVKKLHETLFEDDITWAVMQSQFIRYKSALKSGEIDRQVVKRLEKRINKEYDKGIVEGGNVRPYSVGDLDYLNGVKKGRHIYSKYKKEKPVMDVSYVDSTLEPGENQDNYANIRL